MESIVQLSFGQLCAKLGSLGSLANVVVWLRSLLLLQTYAQCESCQTVYALAVPDETDKATQTTRCPNRGCSAKRNRGIHYRTNSIFYDSNIDVRTQLQVIHCFANSESVKRTQQLIGKKSDVHRSVSKNTVIKLFQMYRRVITHLREKETRPKLGGTTTLTPEILSLCERYKSVNFQADALHALQVSAYREAKQQGQPHSRPEPRRKIFNRLKIDQSLPPLPPQGTSVPNGTQTAGATQTASVVVEMDESKSYLHVLSCVVCIVVLAVVLV